MLDILIYSYYNQGKVNIGVCYVVVSKCNAEFLHFYPSKCKCGYTVPIVDGVYQFTEDKAISAAGDTHVAGYENVGVNYEPGFATSYNDGDFGMFRRTRAGCQN